MIFFYIKAINLLSAIWAAALKMHSTPFTFPGRYLSRDATVSRTSAGVGGTPPDPWCTVWWTLPATWWRWGRQTGLAAGSSWSRCSPGWQGQAQALKKWGEQENSASHWTISFIFSHLGPRIPAPWPWIENPYLRKSSSTQSWGPGILS